ncbi:TPM domain-containing protein [Streptomyces sp. NBC_01465]|uniref:TPM domain-containing protein n=1 Tax=Streptomyces sp. NBC_01465 TaxID=2903878 RepID=UPI002E339B36|nr:TPM domain-containing protein [Streptomyces sp. NBC_01465]
MKSDRPHIPGWAAVLVAAFVAVCGLVLPAPAPAARADSPITLSTDGQITDRVGALRDRKPEVVKALDALYDDHRIQLFVAYVRDFSGQSAQSWADATATKSGLGQNDLLLAVATHDRQYAYSIGSQTTAFTSSQLADVAQTAIVPALKQNDWAGAAIGAANGYSAVLSGTPIPTPTITPGPADPGGSASDEAGSAADVIVPVVAVGGAGALAAFAYTRRKKRAGTRTTPGGGGGWGGPAEPAPMPLPELDAKAKQLLVDTDNAIRTSDEELGFAAAQFGDEAAQPFKDAVTYAKGELTAAFRIRQKLDDAFPEDDATRRQMMDEIVSRCEEANRRLDAESESFDRLRAMEQNAPQALELAESTFRQVTSRTGAAETALATLAQQYAPSASAPVTGHVEQAKDRLLFATTNLNQARQAVDAGDNGKAAVFVRAAEGAVDQAGTLVDAVDRLAGELGEADGQLAGALTETETDLADARGLLQGTGADVSTADLQGRIARAESVVGDVRQEMAAGPYDPIDALRRIEEADAVLDEALAGAREREAGTRRAAALLDQARLTATSSLGAAADYITTNRGAVGSQARTRLAEAQRHLENGLALAATDAQAALAEVQQADALARQAQKLAQQDVQGYGGGGMGGFGGGGGMGGGGGGGIGGAVLGGIILGGLFGGGGGRGGGYGGGGFGGGGPGSFGGGGTGGRMGGGGRF